MGTGLFFILLFGVLVFLSVRSYKKSLFQREVNSEREFQKDILNNYKGEVNSIEDLFDQSDSSKLT